MLNTKSLSIIALSSLLSFGSIAGEIELSKGISTNHTADGYTYNGNHYKFNGDNKLTVLSYRGDNGYRFSVGTFTNSYHNKSSLVSVSKSLIEYKYIDLELEAGLVKGYTKEQVKTVWIGDEYAAYIAPRVSVKLIDNNDYSVKLGATLFGKALIVTSTFSFKF